VLLCFAELFLSLEEVLLCFREVLISLEEVLHCYGELFLNLKEVLHCFRKVLICLKEVLLYFEEALLVSIYLYIENQKSHSRVAFLFIKIGLVFNNLASKYLAVTSSSGYHIYTCSIIGDIQFIRT